MPFDWREFLKIARYFRDNRSSFTFTEEAASRCAVSRAYYAAFRHAIRFAEEKNDGFISSGTRKDHHDIREYYKNKGRTQVADYLGSLGQWREFCDYDDDIGDSSNMLKNSISRAEHIINKLPRPGLT